jgi:uncharacterized membrane protein
MLGYIVQALTLQKGFVMIGIGMWMALIMAFNVWFIIWPNQQKILGLVEATAEQKAAAAEARRSMPAGSTPMFSIGMLLLHGGAAEHARLTDGKSARKNGVRSDPVFI